MTLHNDAYNETLRITILIKITLSITTFSISILSIITLSTAADI
jgi:hypothetical protein